LNGFAILGIAVGLAMDAFAVAVATGLALAEVTGRQKFRLGFHFGLFQFLMPVLGWLAGNELVEYIRAYDHWVAFALLSFVGGKMIWESLKTHEVDRPQRSDPTRGWSLVTLSVATSLDALAVGFSMAALGVSVWLPSVVIGVVTGALTLLGLNFGTRLGARWERWAEALGGGVLLVIGARILYQHWSG
jgi:manganese efflux pump family protein